MHFSKHWRGNIRLHMLLWLHFAWLDGLLITAATQIFCNARIACTDVHSYSEWIITKAIYS